MFLLEANSKIDGDGGDDALNFKYTHIREKFTILNRFQYKNLENRNEMTYLVLFLKLASIFSII